MRVIRTGITRDVILLTKWAVKIPTLRSWEQFLNGLLANMNEKKWSGCAITPNTIYSNRFGFLNIQQRVLPIKCRRGIFFLRLREEFIKNDYSENFWYGDAKPDNFGIDKKGNFVKIDMG